MLIAYHSYEGRFSDSPRALFAELRRRASEARHVWCLDPAHADGFPAGVETVVWGTPECIEVLESADLVVANTHTDLEWRKKPGATYLQTWHGTPLKRIHWDVLWAPEGRLERLQRRDVDQWDLLVSPSPVATPLLRRAFRFEGPVLETGYPRNDVLSGPGAAAVRARVRAELGLADDERAVLWAPTWRDEVVFDGGPSDTGLSVEPAAVADAAGEDAVLLLRLHYMLTGRLGAIDHPRVRDVSFFPDVAELFLAADVLVTDYSSLMFDFAVTGKPILLFVDDLEDYATRQRGFYMDLEEIAPGPLLRTPDELFAAVRDVPVDPERLERFRTTFAGLEDGRAAERVAEAALSAAARPSR